MLTTAVCDEKLRNPVLYRCPQWLCPCHYKACAESQCQRFVVLLLILWLLLSLYILSWTLGRG